MAPCPDSSSQSEGATWMDEEGCEELVVLS